MHPTLGRDRQPLGERDTTVRGDPDKPWAGGDIVTKVVLYFSFQPVRDGYLVQVGVLAVEEECVGAPDLVQELPVHGELGDERRAVVDLDQSEASIVSNQPITAHQPLVPPVLPEVAVQCVPLLGLVYWTHRPRDQAGGMA